MRPGPPHTPTLILATLVLHSLLLQDSIAFRTELPPAVIAGKPVSLVFRLTNRTEQPITLTLQGRPLAFDVTVIGSDGALVWRRLESAVVSSILAVRTLDPAESLVFEAVWDGRDRQGRVAHPGTYLVTGKLLTDTPDGLVTLPAPLTLLAH